MQCTRCNLDFRTLTLRLAVQALAIEGSTIRLYCPMCRQDNALDLRRLNILYRPEGRYYRWRTAPGVTRGGEYLIEFGRLVLVFPEDRVETLTPDKICYRSVPVFQNRDGSLSYPRLPVRKEFVDFIDVERTSPPEVNVERRMYRIELALQGLDTVERIERPLLALGGGRPVLEGAHLVFWPNIPYKGWRQYFARFGYDPERADLYQGTRQVRAYARAQKSSEAPGVTWVEFKALPSGAQVASLMSRPDWLALEFVSPALGEVDGGGLWQVEAPTVPDYPDQTLTIAVDFGTSNTYMAYQVGQGPARPLELKDCSRYLITGSWVPAALTSPEPWLPAKGFAPAGATLPSEIVTVESLERLRGRVNPEDWQPIEDYGILGAGVEVRYPDVEHTIAEFKWQETVSPEGLRGKYEALQVKYLNLLLLVALANLAREERIGKGLEIRFSYPLSFSPDMLDSFDQTLRTVQAYLEQATGLPVRCARGTDEARAASYSIGQLSPEYSAYLFVDIGGGSADISFMIYSESKEAFVIVDSIRYAGGALVTALSRGQCLRTGITPDEFRRHIRETGSLTALQRIGTVFDERRRPMTVHKTEYFYGYLREYVARILAAHFINGEWKDHREDGEIHSIRQEGYRIALYPLGNGWGFGALVHPQFESRVFAADLERRVEAILQEVLGQDRDACPKIQIVAQTLPRDKHPKEVVALGLLEGPTGERKRREVPLETPFRTVLGWTVLVGKTRQVPWHRVTDGTIPPRGEDPIGPGLLLDCPREAPPQFPKDLDGPYDIDQDLNRTRQVLNRECLQGQRWFRRTPMQVMMEYLFKPHLERVV